MSKTTTGKRSILTVAAINKMNKAEALQELKNYGINEAQIKRSDGKPGKPLVKDLRDALIRALGKEERDTNVEEEVNDEEVEEEVVKTDVKVKKPAPKKKKSAAKKKVQQKAVAKSTADQTIMDKLLFHIQRCEKAAEIALEQAKIALKEAAIVRTKLESYEDYSPEPIDVDNSQVPVDSTEELKDLTKFDKVKEDEDEGGIFNEEDSSKEEFEEDIENEESEEDLDEEFEDELDEELEEKKPPKPLPKNNIVEEEFLDSSEEGQEIAKHFVNPPEITKEMFSTFMKRLHLAEFKPSDDIEEISKKIGLKEIVVHTIIANHQIFEERWPDVLTKAKEIAKEAVFKKPSGAPGHHNKLKPR